MILRPEQLVDLTPYELDRTVDYAKRQQAMAELTAAMSGGVTG